MPLFVLLLACDGLLFGGGETTSPNTGPVGTDPSPTQTPDGTAATADTATPTGPTADTVPDTGFTFDGPTADSAYSNDTGSTGDDPCDVALLSSRAASVTELTGIPESEDFEFDAFGNLVNVSNALDAVMTTTYAGVSTLVTPFSSIEIAGTRMLPDGQLVFADEWDGSIVKVDMTTGARSVLASGLVSPNSLAVDSDGVVYSGGFGEIAKIYPDGSVERILEVSGEDFDGLALTPDELTLLFNQDDGGEVARIDFDAKGNVVDTRTVVDLINGGWGTSLNGATTDVCGRYYVVDVGGRVLRVDPETETVLEYADLDSVGAGYTTSIRFGSGIGGWELDRLYVIDRDDTVWELQTDVDGVLLPHL